MLGRSSPVLSYVINFKRLNRCLFSASPAEPGAQMQVQFKHPQTDEQDQIIFQFCFPNELVGTQREKRETFSFVLTGSDGMRQYGYCLREIHPSFTDCFCLIAPHGSFRFYNEIIQLFKQHIGQKTKLTELAECLLKLSYPFPDSSVLIKTPSITKSIKRSGDDTFADPSVVSVCSLVDRFGASEVVDLLSHIMLERKLLFVGDDLSVISNTISTFLSLLCPFVWQHVLIPLLPKSLVTYCAAPMPYIIGCLRELYPQVVMECGDLSDVFIIDITKFKYINKPDFEMMLFSDNSVGLRNILSNLKGFFPDVSRADFKITDEAVVRAQFLKFMQRMFLGYNNYFKKVKPEKSDQTTRFKPIKFKWSKFLKHVDEDTALFLNEFRESQMLYMFLDEREDMIINNISLQPICPLLIIPTQLVTQQVLHWKVLVDYIPTPTPQQKLCALCKSDLLANIPCSLWEGAPVHSKCYRCLSCFKVIVGDKETKTHQCLNCAMTKAPIKERTEEDYQKMFSKHLQKLFDKKKRKKELKNELLHKSMSLASFMKASTPDHAGSEQAPAGDPKRPPPQLPKKEPQHSSSPLKPATPAKSEPAKKPKTRSASSADVPKTEKEKPKESKKPPLPDKKKTPVQETKSATGPSIAQRKRDLERDGLSTTGKDPKPKQSDMVKSTPPKRSSHPAPSGSIKKLAARYEQM